jgi:alpha-beta hydrolase superfamily lysophospholipase/DNA-binding CsgD family transcriptional regulator
MSEIEQSAFFTSSRDGHPLYLRVWMPARPIRGAVLVGHTQAAHSGYCVPACAALAARGFRIVTGDLRGHGLSVTDETPVGHMGERDGWHRALEDFRVMAEHAFQDVPVDRRMIVGSNITALGALEYLKRTPDDCHAFVLITPPPLPNPALKLARLVCRFRLASAAPAAPDTMITENIFRFLAARIPEIEELSGVTSADPQIRAAFAADPAGFPTPSARYWDDVIAGVGAAWAHPLGERLERHHRFVLMHGTQCPMTDRGRLLPAVRERLLAHGAGAATIEALQGGRGAPIVDERLIGISARLAAAFERLHAPEEMPPEALVTVGGETPTPREASRPAASVVQSTARSTAQSPVPDPLAPASGAWPAELVPRMLNAIDPIDLCYDAVESPDKYADLVAVVSRQLQEDRDLRAADLSDPDAFLPASLAPEIRQVLRHWVRSYELHQRFAAREAQSALLQTLLDRMRIGMALLDQRWQVRESNRAFRRRLAELTAAGSPEPRDLQVALRALLQTCAPLDDRRGGPDRTLPLGDRAGGQPLADRDGRNLGLVLPPGELVEGAAAAGIGHALILFAAPRDAPAGGDESILQVLFGLTASEAEVALHVCSGLGPDEIAARRGSAVATVRTQLKSVLRKVGVASQTELVSVLLRGPLKFF